MVQWTTEADEAFRRMKELLEALPTVLSDKPIKQILARPKKSGRIAKWAIELGEHEIESRGRNSVKGQILADFLAETPSKDEEGAKDEEAKRKEPEPKKAWKLFTDGASSSDGSRASLILVSPEGKEYTYTLRFEFKTTNNEAEYEALLAGLRIAKEMKVQELTIFVDSQLVANQVNGLFEERDQNKKADALSKLASMTFSNLVKEVLVEFIQDKSITQRKVADVTQEKEDSWMIPIQEYLQSYLSPWLRCVGETQAKSIIQEVHQGSCGMHAGPRSVMSKILRLGYYWPSMHKDAKGLIQRCETFQIHSLIPRKPKQEMTSIMSAWPFSQWGIDIVGPFPIAPGGARFLVVATDYFTK
ncbi:reverse transcriptase domain-containing protein [Tanacetum coccineum]